MYVVEVNGLENGENKLWEILLYNRDNKEVIAIKVKDAIDCKAR